jgi:hypothetical protein
VRPQTELTPLMLQITHSRGASSFRMDDGSGAFTGTVSADGALSIGPVDATTSGNIPIAVSFAGAFSRTGVEMRLTVIESRPGAACRHRIDWKATKVGEPNDIPGAG